RTRDNRAADDVVVLSGRLKEAKDKVEEMSQRARLTSDEMAELEYGRRRVDDLTRSLKRAQEAQKLLADAGKDVEKQGKTAGEAIEDVGGTKLGAELEKFLRARFGGLCLTLPEIVRFVGHEEAT